MSETVSEDVVAFVFARGGSKGLPNKNILQIDGVPLIGHSIKMAISAGIKKIYISSDSDEIIRIGVAYGAIGIKRPDDLATDTASELDAWKHAIKFVQKTENFKVFISLPATSPLRNEYDILESIEKIDSNTDLIITVTESNRSPYFNMVEIGNDGYCKIVLDKINFTRRQDVPKVYDVTTVAYVSTPEYILNTNNIMCGKIKAVIIPKARSIDIDDSIDFEIARSMYKRK